MNAAAASDALRRVRFGDRVCIHRTDITALPAGDALLGIVLHAVYANLIKQAVECSERTHDFAEEPVADYASDNCPC